MIATLRRAIGALISRHKAARRLRKQRRNARTNGAVLTDTEIMRRLGEVPEGWRDLIDVTTKAYGTEISA